MPYWLLQKALICHKHGKTPCPCQDALLKEINERGLADEPRKGGSDAEAD